MKLQQVVVTTLFSVFCLAMSKVVHANELCDSVPPVEVGSISGADTDEARSFIEKNADLLNLQIVWKAGDDDAACALLTVVEIYKVRSDDRAGVAVAYHHGASQIWNFEPGKWKGNGKIKNGKLAIKIIGQGGGGVRIDTKRTDSGIEATWRGRQPTPGTVVSLPPL